MQEEQNHRVSPFELEINARSLQHETNGRNTLVSTLAKLDHLNLLGRVTYDNSVLASHGGYSDIFIGELSLPIDRKITVAVKRLRIVTVGNHKLDKRVSEEISVWSKLNHCNILPLRGFVMEGSYPCLVSDWMKHGTLADYVACHPECDVVYMLEGTARGLAYLHSMDIVHSDIKAYNVLVSQAGEPLICDFGISRRLSPTQTAQRDSSTSAKGSYRWMSPELLMPVDDKTSTKQTKKSDVWAFGMLIYELLASKLPFGHLKHDGQVLMAIVYGQLPPLPIGPWPWSIDRVWTLLCPLKACWDKDPGQRPSMEETLTYLGLCQDTPGTGPGRVLADFATWLADDVSSCNACPDLNQLHAFCSPIPNEHQLISLHGRHSSSLDRSQKFSEDESASQLPRSEIHPNISIVEILDQVQKVGYAFSAEETFASISTFLEQFGHSDAAFREKAGQIRMEAVKLFRSTFSAESSSISLFSIKEFQTMASGGQHPTDIVRARDTDKALETVALLVEIIRAGIGTSSDLVTAVALIYEHRQREGYIPLLYLLLEAGKDFTYTYSDVKFLATMMCHLQTENGPLINEITSVITGIRCSRPV